MMTHKQMNRLNTRPVSDIEILLVLIFLFLTALSVPSQLFSQQDVFSPHPGASTPCLPNGGQYALNTSISLTNLESARLRYGRCFANFALAGCRISTPGCRVDESLRAEIQELYSRLGRCKVGVAILPTEEKTYDIGLTGSIGRLRAELATCEGGSGSGNGNNGGGASICPPGTSCQGPCPICPPVPICPPIETLSFTYTKISLPPTNQRIRFWDSLAQLEHEGMRSANGLWITIGGTFADSQVYAWQVVTPIPPIK